MNARELIAELEQLDMDLPVYIGDVSLGPLIVYSLGQEQIDESEWEEAVFVGYKKIEAIVLWR